MTDAYDVLREKIEARLSAPNIEDNGEIISLQSLLEALQKGIGRYNKTLVKDSNELAKLINSKTRLNRLFKETYPVISKFSPVITEDGEPYIEVLFSDCDNRYVGSATFDGELNINFEYLKAGYSMEKTEKLLKKYQSNFILYLYCLDQFAEEYPNTRMEWNNNYEPARQVVDDGFLTANYYLDDLSRSNVTFSDLNDSNLARTHTRKYGELYDYITFYEGKIMRSTPVDINNLNDIYQKIARKALNLEKGQTLNRVK